MSTLTAATFGFATAAFTACSDELDIEKAPVAPESAKTRSIDTPADKYNFNEMDPNENGNFDRLHWRNQTSIYLRVSSDDYADKSITDTKGRTRLPERETALGYLATVVQDEPAQRLL